MALFTPTGWQCRQRIVCLLLLGSHAVWAEDASIVFEEAKAFGRTQQARAVNSISTQSAQDNIPNYTTSAKESSLFDQGKGALFVPGKGKITHCATGPKADSSYRQQECDVVNFLAKNPQQRPKIVIDKNTDPLLISANHLIQNLSQVGANNEQCRVVTETTPASYVTETCTETRAIETITCHRGASANVGAVPQSYSVNQGSQVPPWTAKTFQLTMTVKGTPNRFTLARYQIDNYGQLWINGTKVYENVLPGFSDMRNGKVGSWQPPKSKNVYTAFIHEDGHVLGNFYDDGCNGGCRGVSPNLDITPHIQEGDNHITLVCANANAIGPCAINIVGSSNQFLGAILQNGCQALEDRAQ